MADDPGTPYGALVDRVAGLEPLLGADRPLAERVVAICREIEQRPRREGGVLVPLEGDLALRRELGRLTEQLGRRASQTLPAATLGRAALADLHGDVRSLRSVLVDCEAKLALLGH
jgi:hypothetical protein